MSRKLLFHGNIPKILHFIWFGREVSEEDRSSLIQWAEKHPLFEVILWVESEEKAQHYAQAEFAIEHDILVKSIADYVSLEECGSTEKKALRNIDLTRKHLARENYTGASDVLRDDLMVALGGFYFDIGEHPKKPLSELEMGLTQCFFYFEHDVRPWSHGEKVFFGVNCFMASKPDHPLFMLSQLIMRLFDGIFEKPVMEIETEFNYTQSKKQVQKAIDYHVTVSRTGYALFAALQVIQKSLGALSSFSKQYGVEAFDVFEHDYAIFSDDVGNVRNALSAQDNYKIHRKITETYFNALKTASTVVSHIPTYCFMLFSVMLQALEFISPDSILDRTTTVFFRPQCETPTQQKITPPFNPGLPH